MLITSCLYLGVYNCIIILRREQIKLYYVYWLGRFETVWTFNLSKSLKRKEEFTPHLRIKMFYVRNSGLGFFFSDTTQLCTYGYGGYNNICSSFFLSSCGGCYTFRGAVWGWIFIMNFGNPGCWCPFGFFPTSTLLRTAKI